MIFFSLTVEIILLPVANAEETVPMLPGQHFVLNCDTGGGQFFQWQKNGYPMPGQCQPKLVFRAFSGNDEGRYSCHVTNRNGFVTTTNIIHLQRSKDFNFKADFHLAIFFPQTEKCIALRKSSFTQICVMT